MIADMAGLGVVDEMIYSGRALSSVRRNNTQIREAVSGFEQKLQESIQKLK